MEGLLGRETTIGELGLGDTGFGEPMEDVGCDVGG
jgi:hypothetical protein